MLHPHVCILDCTLRDGSYSVDFQFTVQDTFKMASAMDQAGIPWIEIGHGLGLGASQKGYGVALESDTAYCKAVSGKLQQAKWGMFCIPGIASESDIDLLADYGADFVRVGTDVDRVHDAQPFIQKALSRGLIVFSNLMKSYTVSPEAFTQSACIALDAGAHGVAVVDSAGGMLPDDVKRYVSTLKAKRDCVIGFHGHNNLDLAVANSLAAVEAGATLIDTSLQGLGRSAGNTITEVFAMVLQKKGYACPVDLKMLMDLGEKYIEPLLKENKFNPINMVSGFAQFHSSFLDSVLSVAQAHQIDPRDLILAVTQHSQTHAPRELLEDLAGHLAKQTQTSPVTRLTLPETYVVADTQTLKQAVSHARKTQKNLVYNLVYHPDATCTLSQNIQQDSHTVLLNGQGSNLQHFELILAQLENQGADLVLLDKRFPAQPVTTLPVITYDDQDLWATAILFDLNASFAGQALCFLGNHPIQERLLQKQTQFAFTLSQPGEQADVLVSFDSAQLTTLPNLTAYSAYYDAVIGGFTPVIDQFHGKPIYRVNMAPALFGYLYTLHGYQSLIQKRGRIAHGQTHLVSGGVIGEKGDIVVDDVHNPTTILGVADGAGGLEKQLTPYQTILDDTQRFIAEFGLT